MLEQIQRSQDSNGTIVTQANPKNKEDCLHNVGSFCNLEVLQIIQRSKFIFQILKKIHKKSLNKFVDNSTK